MLIKFYTTAVCVTKRLDLPCKVWYLKKYQKKTKKNKKKNTSIWHPANIGGEITVIIRKSNKHFEPNPPETASYTMFIFLFKKIDLDVMSIFQIKNWHHCCILGQVFQTLLFSVTLKMFKQFWNSWSSLSLFLYKEIGVHGTAIWNSAMLVSVQISNITFHHLYYAL